MAFDVLQAVFYIIVIIYHVNQLILLFVGLAIVLHNTLLMIMMKIIYIIFGLIKTIKHHGIMIINQINRHGLFVILIQIMNINRRLVISLKVVCALIAIIVTIIRLLLLRNHLVFFFLKPFLYGLI